MADFIALCAGALLAVILLLSTTSQDWTPSFLIVVGILAVIVLGSLLIGQLGHRGSESGGASDGK